MDLCQFHHKTLFFSVWEYELSFGLDYSWAKPGSGHQRSDALGVDDVGVAAGLLRARTLGGTPGAVAFAETRGAGGQLAAYIALRFMVVRETRGEDSSGKS